MSQVPRFVEELKRRKVVRVAVVYLAVTWAVVQVADVFVPALGLPESLITTVAVLAIFGFPVALALAWAFQVTPEGVQRTASAEETPASTSWVGGGTVLAAVALVIAGYFAGSLFGGADADDSEVDRMAIAVIPFQSRGAEDNMGFADGMHDDILTQLSRIDALRVTSRTSVETYRNTTLNIREIAAELGVATVLEGGVQRTQDRVRINMQLINGASDEHLWAETFDRELTAENVFAIQSEIARAVAGALKATLTADDESELAEVPTQNLEALDLYHRARRLYDGLDPAGSVQAVTVLERAVERDPTFARAWAELTRVRSWQIRMGRVGDTLPARQALERTLALAPGTVDAALAAGHYRYYARGDYQGALRAFRQAAGGQSGDTDLKFAISYVLRRLGDWDESTELLEDISRAAPKDGKIAFDLAWQYRMTRRFEESEEVYQRIRRLAPEEVRVLGLMAEVAMLGYGDTVAARETIDESARIATDDQPDMYRALLKYFRREPEPLEALTDAQGFDNIFADYSLYPDGPLDLWKARVAWVLGDTARARVLTTGAEDAYLSTKPVIQPGSNVVPPDEDIFGHRASQFLLRAWERAFSGDPQGARAAADRARSLQSYEDDASQAYTVLRQRALIRIVTGDLDGAMADLREVLARPGLSTVWELRLDPIYDPLRERTDFQALLAGGG